jgi:hypothetical protein
MSSPALATSDSAARRVVRAAPWCALAYGLGLYAASRLEVPTLPVAMALTGVVYLVFPALLLVASAGLAIVALPRVAEPALLALGTGAWYALTHVPGKTLPPWAAAGAAVAMIVAVSGLARVLVTWVLREKNLLPVALVLMGLVDVWGVTVGFTAQMLTTSPETVAKASASLPGIACKALPPGVHLPDLSIGPGDILFIALVLTMAARHGMGLRRNMVWMYALILVALAAVIVLPVAIPGLVFVAAAGLLANRGQWTYTSEERRSLAVAAAVALPLLVLVGLRWHATHPPPAPAAQGDEASDGKRD